MNWLLLYTAVIGLLAAVIFYIFGLLIASRNKIIISRARAINDAIGLCIIDAEEADDDQISEYSRGWTAACIHIGEKLGEVRDVAISEVKARQ